MWIILLMKIANVVSSEVYTSVHNVKDDIEYPMVRCCK